MKIPVIRLEEILKAQIDIYEKIVAIEEQKSQVIMARKGKEIEALSLEQEKLLKVITVLEEKRLDAIEEYRKIYHLDDLAGDITITEIVRAMDEDSTHKLMRYAMQLKKIMLRIKSLQDTNQTLLRDNIEFFNIMLSTLKDSVSVKGGYSAEGAKQQIVSDSVLFNKTV